MKRSRLGPGAKSRERGSTFASSGAAPKRARKPPRSVMEQQAWARAARSMRCVVSGAANPSGHHIITKQRLRARAAELGISPADLLWDQRNLLPLAEQPHAAHHAWSRRISWQQLAIHAPKVFQFARELQLEPWLERNYPRREDA